MKYRVELVKGSTYFIYGHLFKKGWPIVIEDAEAAADLKQRKNFKVTEASTDNGQAKGKAVEDKVPPKEENIVDGEVKFTKSQLIDLQKEGQVKILVELGLDPAQYKNEAERVEAILSAQVK